MSIRREVVDRHPDLPAKLTRAFMEARDVATQYMPAEEIAGYQKERDVLGEDPYAYVMGENEKRTLGGDEPLSDRARTDENHAADGRAIHRTCVRTSLRH